MSEFTVKRRVKRDIEFIEESVKNDPKITLKLLDQFQRKSMENYKNKKIFPKLEHNLLKSVESSRKNSLANLSIS